MLQPGARRVDGLVVQRQPDRAAGARGHGGQLDVDPAVPEQQQAHTGRLRTLTEGRCQRGEDGGAIEPEVQPASRIGQPCEMTVEPGSSPRSW